MKYFIVVDAQNDFITGALANPTADKRVPEIRRTLDNITEDYKIILTQDTHDKVNYLNTLEGKLLPVGHCFKGETGWLIDDRIVWDLNKPLIYVEKPTFGYIDWDFIIKDPEEIHICGFCTDICVVSNALILRALFPDTRIVFHADLSAGTSEEAHNATKVVMTSCQIEVEGE